MAKKSKTIFSIIISVVIILLGTFFILRYLVVKSLPDYNENVKIDGLKSEVSVFYDKYAVPHIYAKNQSDLLFVQGYIHAQERLWQMDLIRRAGEGRLSEIFGASTISYDRQLRVMGIKSIAKKIDETLSKEDKFLLQSYADGVNALRSKNRSFLIITHYQRLLDYIKPDFVHVMVNGSIVKTGCSKLAQELDKIGYKEFQKAV